MLAPAVRHLSFERADGQAFAFTPGQFIQIHFHYADGKPTKRSYSVGTIHDGSGVVERLEIAVSYVEGGAATEILSQLDEGGTIDASGPYGRFCLMDADANTRYLLVATGTGVTPYRAMLPQIRTLTQTRGCTFALVYGARNEAELLYGDEFEAFAREVPGFSFHACFSRVPRAVPRPHDRNGRASANSAPTPNTTLPTCAATRTWSMRRSRCSRKRACPCRTSAARSTCRRARRRPIAQHCDVKRALPVLGNRLAFSVKFP